MAHSYRRWKQKVEAQSYSEQDRCSKTRKLEEPVSDAARRDEQQRQHHAHTELRKEEEECRRNHLVDGCALSGLHSQPLIRSRYTRLPRFSRVRAGPTHHDRSARRTSIAPC